MCIRGRRACFAWPLAGGAAGHAGGRKHDDLLLRPEGHSQLRHQGVRPPRTQIAVPPPPRDLFLSSEGWVSIHGFAVLQTMQSIE